MTAFYELSRPARVVRLRRAALAALDRFGIEVQRLKFTSNHHIIFQVTDRAGRRYSLKFYLGINPPPAAHDFTTQPWEPQFGTPLELQILWQEALARDTDLRLAAPLRTRDGEIAPTCTVDGLPEPVTCTLSTWCPGRAFARTWPCPRPGRRLTREVGRLTATLHNHAEQWRLPRRFRRRKIGWQATAARIFEHVLTFPPVDKALSQTERRALDQTLDHILAVFDRLGTGKKHYGLIHEDIHPGNLILHRGQFALIDFNNASFGYYLYDMVHLLCDTPEFYAPNYTYRYPAYFAGYAEARPLPDDYPQIAQAMVAYWAISETSARINYPDPTPWVLKYKLPRVLWLAARLAEGRPFPEL